MDVGTCRSQPKSRRRRSSCNAHHRLSAPRPRGHHTCDRARQLDAAGRRCHRPQGRRPRPSRSFVNKSLRQVTAYLTEGDLRSQIQERVLRHLDDDTKIIIGHSLGSVVAYEIAANYLAKPLPLLLTLGSPLGLRTIVYDRVQPQPPIFPALVERWVNIADRNDLVAADLDLDPLFVQNGPSGAAVESSWTVDNGAKPHEATFYLTKRKVGEALADALD